MSLQKVDVLLFTSVDNRRKLVHSGIADYERNRSLMFNEDIVVQLRKSLRHNLAI